MKFTDRTLAEEEWYKFYGSWPTESDFAWPIFRDAYDAGRESVVTSDKTFYEILRSKFLFSSEVSNNILHELDKWLSEIQTSCSGDDRVSISTIRKKIK
jgi:hypothetical protein